MKVTSWQREAVRRGARSLGLEPALRRVYERLEPSARRDRLDNEHLSLLIALALHEDANCIDIGAHNGTLLREMVRCAPSGRHIAYEPLPEFAAALQRDFPTCDVRNAAVSDASGEATFYRVGDDPMQSGLKRRDQADEASSQAIQVRVDRLDDALDPEFVPALIKIDVEGNERQVLEGALRTIRTHAPIICFEHGPGADHEYETTPEAVFDLLSDEAGMRIFDIDGRGPYTRAMFIAVYPEPIWNFVAHR